MADLQIAQVGCGGMGLRHLFGQIESKLVFGTFDYVAVCDLNTSAAEHVASEAERGLGKRPRVYNDFDEMLDKETSLDAVDIVTDAGLHHVLALKAFDAASPQRKMSDLAIMMVEDGRSLQVFGLVFAGGRAAGLVTIELVGELHPRCTRLVPDQGAGNMAAGSGDDFPHSGIPGIDGRCAIVLNVEWALL